MRCVRSSSNLASVAYCGALCVVLKPYVSVFTLFLLSFWGLGGLKKKCTFHLIRCRNCSVLFITALTCDSGFGSGMFLRE